MLLFSRISSCRASTAAAASSRVLAKTVPSRTASASSLPPRLRSRAPVPSVSPVDLTTLRPRFISHTPFARARITVNVPTMGDSITEGTVVEWCVPPGSLVREGDVVALIETDKVTVDIKADRDGVIVKQLEEVEGVVEVGSGLYVLDTDASKADAAAAADNADVAEANASLDAGEIAAEPPAPAAAPSEPSHSERAPSIRFLGKEGWKARLAGTDAAPVAAASPSPTTVVPASGKPNAPTSITQVAYSPMYGRPPITDDEMEALILGGAEEAPEVRKVVSEDGLSGVVFAGGKVVTAGPRGVWLAE
ncbi:hypothetical protein ACHAWF_003437 [Thalassiosira exigua]